MNDWNFPRESREVLLPLEVKPAEGYLEILPNGHEAVIFGDPKSATEGFHQQGDNPFGMRGTCGLVSVEDILRQLGYQVTETDLVSYAVRNQLCTIEGTPDVQGGTTQIDQARILNDFGVPAEAKILLNCEDLASYIEAGEKVIVGVNGGVLWNVPEAFEFGQANHAVTVTGVARNPQTADLLGFFINDSGSGEAGRFVDLNTWQWSWENRGGLGIVTNLA
ncbi:hypothetical protein HJG54_29835 [Leptolyngbya sp. NK1-12]|uniref:Peptidase C39-like domain-containing protein n=1 Tax=Leptolyngbya sp. NK1-12 TaxID=2547451 RepID=A0AA96WKU7_9CYAN|nr:hypothetical protein [Leptolyngbya sp. NK1-12]WNZ27114.1 hypothetical protein HJG54_29835 [Leptolyngbya sp. NK1-12]